MYKEYKVTVKKVCLVFGENFFLRSPAKKCTIKVCLNIYCFFRHYMDLS